MKAREIVIHILMVTVSIAVLGCGYILFKNAKSTGSITEDVVYTKTNSLGGNAKDTAEDLLNSSNISSEEKNYYKEKTMDQLNSYFNISYEDFEHMNFIVNKINEGVITKIQEEAKSSIKSDYAKNKITKEQYDDKMEDCNNGTYAYWKDMVKELDHDLVETVWTSRKKIYECRFNENTKEIDAILVTELPDDFKESEKFSEEAMRGTAEDFINKNFSDYDNLEFTQIKRNENDKYGNLLNTWFVCFKDKSDESKMIIIGINEDTGKINYLMKDKYAKYMLKNQMKANNIV